MKWSDVQWEPYDPPPTCGARRGPRSRTRCELPPDHVTGRNFKPMLELAHTGRSRSGRWYSWPAPEFGQDGTP